MDREANIDSDTQNRWILGDSVPGATFSMNQRVRVTSGPHTGARGVLISLYALQPEPLYHLETSENDDHRVYQSELTADQ